MAVQTLELFKEAMKFSAGHFTIFSAAERENLHGHNFTLHVTLSAEVGANGMLADYGLYKRWLIERCRAWNETFLLPERSPHLRVERLPDGNVRAQFADETLHFLARDVTLLPVSNVSLEELSRLFGEGMVADDKLMRADPIVALTVKCASGPGQWASWSWQK